MAYARRTDGTHAAIVKALRKVGCQVKDTSRVGEGFPDLVVRRKGFGCVPGSVVLMEVKAAKGKLTADQEQFLADWPETVVVRSVAEALAAVGIVENVDV